MLILFLLLFSFSNSIISLIFWFFITLIIGGVIIRTSGFYNWISYLIFIFLLGGLIISVIYIVGLIPNTRIKLYNINIILIYIFILFSITIKKTFSRITLERISKFSETLKISLFSLSVYSIILFFFLFIILLFIDKTIGDMKGYMRY